MLSFVLMNDHTRAALVAVLHRVIQEGSPTIQSENLGIL